MNLRAFAFAAVAALSVSTLPAFANLTLTSSSVQDGALGDTAYGAADKGGDGLSCGGENISPALTWFGASEKTQSYAITMFDPEGRGGQGVSHWVLYNIPASITFLARGAGAGPNAPYSPGKGQGGWTGYRGSCPPHGDAPHHYTIEVYALDIPPTLPPNLDRDGLFKAIAGHTLGAAGTVMKYTRRP
jgi:Raf kinase inhibitor-like YbhB/YbcL family protein